MTSLVASPTTGEASETEEQDEPLPYIEHDQEKWLDSGMTCRNEHPLWLVCEGYGLCENQSPEAGCDRWSPWSFASRRSGEWHALEVNNGPMESAFYGPWFESKEDAIAFITKDIVRMRQFYRDNPQRAEEYLTPINLEVPKEDGRDS